MRDGKGRLDIARYIAHRIVRIVPPFYGALALLTVVSVAAGYHVERLAPVNVAHQVFFIDKGTDFINPSFWTLPIEMRWYVLMPIALWAWIRVPKAFLIASIFVILTQQTRAQSTDLYALPAFLFGIIAAEAFVRPASMLRYVWPLAMVSFFITLLVSPRHFNGSIQIGWEITAVLFVIAVGIDERARRLLSVPLLTFIGTASYSIYLVHMPIMDILESHGIHPAFAATAGILAGIAFWAVAERPFVKSRLRDALLRSLEPAIRNLLPMFGIGDRIALERRVPQQPEIRTLAERAKPAAIEEPALSVGSS